MNVLMLCRKKDLKWFHWGYARAFARSGVDLTCVRDDTSFNADIKDLIAKCHEPPSLILQPETDFSFLPSGLTKTDVPTACFQYDTYAYTHRRIRWSMLYDHPIVFHPGYEENFRSAGHQGVFTLHHAASQELFSKPEEERTFEVGWVGRTSGHYHTARRKVLTVLAREFQMNDWQRLYEFHETADVYRRSKIVVNVARDDFAQDANMRAFEAMAGGALLINRIPTDLAVIGFQEGLHFVGYHDMSEIVPLAHRYLRDESERRRIANAGRETVLREHTYDCRVRSILERVERNVGQFLAPARQWSEDRVRLAYLDYYAAHLQLDCARAELYRLARLRSRRALTGAALVFRAKARQLQQRFRAQFAGS